MSKAILIIDMPNTCKECTYCISEEIENHTIHYCLSGKEGLVDIKDLNDKPKWCSLKPLPTKQPDIMDTDGDYGFDGGWNEGYNACIDDILGGKQ